MAREKAARLFRFLKEYATIRFPYVRDLDQVKWMMWLSELPEHPAISVQKIVASDEQGDEQNKTSLADEPLICIRRPKPSQPPAPPSILRDWLKPGWDDPFKEPEVHHERLIQEHDGSSTVERFDADGMRVSQWRTWIAKWQDWASKERVARQAMKIYERFHELLGELQREAERYELVLADGILSWRWAQGSIYFPIILLPVQLEFDPSKPEFRICDAGRNLELYTAPLRDAPLPNPQVLSFIQNDMLSGKILVHPLEEVDTTAFLRRLVHSLAAGGQYLESGLPPRDTQHPCIARSPLLLLRERAQGFSRAVELILQDLEQRSELSPALASIVGADDTMSGPTGRGLSAEVGERSSAEGDDEDLERVLFTKPWNREQLRIASKLNRFGCVIVQGPPGTGKTHTIANLIGHLLAQGKSVLVTAHTAKALKMVREHIVDSLRSLAVAVLGNDIESRKQLEEAVFKITQYLSAYNAADLHQRANRLERQRHQLLRKVAELRQELVEAIGSEYRSIVVAGREYEPSKAARLVADGIGRDDWIPEPVELGAVLPLSVEELAELYRLNHDLSPEDEREMRGQLPDPETLPAPEQLDELFTLAQRSIPEGHQPGWWTQLPDTSAIPELEALTEQVCEVGQHLLEAEAWELKLIEVGSSETSIAPYESLFKHAAETSELVASNIHTLAEHRPELAKDIPLEEQERIARELAAAAERRGGRISWLDTFLKPARQRFISSVRVAGYQPVTTEHFQALAVAAAIQRRRESLRYAWASLITQLGGPDPSELGNEPERSIVQRAEQLLQWLRFQKETLRPIRERLRALGFKWDRAYKLPKFQNDVSLKWRKLGEFLVNELATALKAVVDVIRREAANQELNQLAGRFKDARQGTISAAIRQAIQRCDSVAYRAAYHRLLDLHARQGYFQRREELLARLEPVAPGWVSAIRLRQGVHGKPELPGDPEAAWIWRQLHDELVRRAQISVQELQEQLQDCLEQLRCITADLVESRTWAYRLEKTTQKQRQALIGWLNTMRRLGKGTGKQAPRLRAEAARLLTLAKDAVPVWIMPLARVAEQFDPRSTRFDVVIIDEASQCDMLGLIAFYLGKKVVVVGDHEQVSPEGVGLELERINALQAEHLQGIPNAHLYDGKRSIYDIARESFGGTIMLVEHFRCVPEIIQFSNILCYGGRIRPLRDSSEVPLKPHVVPYRVRGGVYRNRRNEAEAYFIASLIVAMTKHPAYRDKTIGVISMVGDEQAKFIEKLLQNWLPAQELMERRILCGNPAQFQGDERDVVLLSMVDSPNVDGRPLPMRDDDRFKQRFNVAASRARDQLWVIYSLDPKADLQEGDLRRRLIEYAIEISQNPDAFLRSLQEESEKAESPFEREVLEWLMRAGYRVQAQVPVGCYRIDLVVEGEGRRVAVECDGDRWHPEERIWEDLERQAVLERLGWRFIRIRGSEFYRDREGTMRRVIAGLERMGVKPSYGRIEPDDDHRTASSDLVNQLIRKAEEIRRQMGVEVETLVPSKQETLLWEWDGLGAGKQSGKTRYGS